MRAREAAVRKTFFHMMQITTWQETMSPARIGSPLTPFLVAVVAVVVVIVLWNLSGLF